MDTPLLALTRRRAPSRTGPSPEATAADNMRQLVQLRWIAVAGQLVTILVVERVLKVPLPIAPMLGVVTLLALANLVAGLALSRHRVTKREITLALLFDMGALTAQLYMSGGAANPFISLYLLQVVLGAILLDLWSVWVLVGIASLCYAGLTAGNVPLVYPTDLLPQIGDLYTLGAWISFALTGVLLAQFISRISRNLRARDTYVADLRQCAVEEDGIVRMGLFASGAAHELGTPLASLSVMLNDWQRMPRLAGDPELANELDEMQAEVRRCKTIVTDVLHSAGEPRGEALGTAPVPRFLDEVLAGWRSMHPTRRVAYSCGDVRGATVAADPALRQAIWNMLDNAAEASQDGVGLSVERAADDLVISVTDDGPGFPLGQLASIGRPYQSSKGPGHGLGLFLASSVARRLGGRLEATNQPEGGAKVTLILPVAQERGRTP